MKAFDPRPRSPDPAAFERLSRALEMARSQLAEAEAEGLELEGRREALEAGRAG